MAKDLRHPVQLRKMCPQSHKEGGLEEEGEKREEEAFITSHPPFKVGIFHAGKGSFFFFLPMKKGRYFFFSLSLSQLFFLVLWNQEFLAFKGQWSLKLRSWGGGGGVGRADGVEREIEMIGMMMARVKKKGGRREVCVH